MLMKKINNRTMILKVADSVGIDKDIVESIINEYFSVMKGTLIDENKIKTPLGDIFISKRNLNQNVSNKKAVYKLNFKITDEFRDYLEEFKGVN